MALYADTGAPKRLLKEVTETLRDHFMYRNLWRVRGNGKIESTDIRIIGHFRATVIARKSVVFGFVPPLGYKVDTISYALLHAKLVEVLLTEHDDIVSDLRITVGMDDTYDG